MTSTLTMARLLERHHEHGQLAFLVRPDFLGSRMNGISLGQVLIVLLMLVLAGYLIWRDVRARSNPTKSQTLDAVELKHHIGLLTNQPTNERRFLWPSVSLKRSRRLRG